MSERGGQIDAVQNGRMRIEKERNRLINNDGSTDVLLIGDRGDGTIVVDLAREGFDVKTADINDLVFSSRFNLYKIIHHGRITAPTPRNATVTLSGNNIAYIFNIRQRLDLGATGKRLEGDLLINVCWDRNKVPIKSAGLFYYDGTNRVEHRWSSGYSFNTDELFVRYELRLISGSLSLNPATSGRVPFTNDIYYQVANMTQANQGGMGGVGPGDGKFYYLDEIVYNPDGTVMTPLTSTTGEFMNGDWAYFPAPLR